MQRWLTLFAALSVPSFAACGIVSGLDHLQNTACVGPCGEDEDASNETGGSDASGAEAGSDASEEAEASTKDASTTDVTEDTTTADAPGPDATEADVASADVHAETGPTCVDDLSNVATGDFRISFSVSTTQSGIVAVLNQRIVCGTQSFWDIRIVDGHIYVEIDDGTNFTTLPSTAAINNGQPHTIVVQRIALSLTISIDAQASGSMQAKASLKTLPPLRTGTDPCQSPNQGSDGTVAFSGVLKDVCLVRL